MPVLISFIEKTFFIPFNQGSNGAGEVGGAGNPEREDSGYVTAYLWEKVLRRDMLLSILQRYISRQEEEKRDYGNFGEDNLSPLSSVGCGGKVGGRYLFFKCFAKPLQRRSKI